MALKQYLRAVDRAVQKISKLVIHGKMYGFLTKKHTNITAFQHLSLIISLVCINNICFFAVLGNILSMHTTSNGKKSIKQRPTGIIV
jgi:hypothetical protein